MSKEAFVYYWNELLDREFSIPEDIVHFKEVLPLKHDGFMKGHCFGNSIKLKLGIDASKKNGYKFWKPHPELDVCVGLAIKDVFFNFIASGNIDKFRAMLRKSITKRDIVEPVPCVLFHAWNLSKGKVFDYTWGKGSADTVYLGWVLSSQDLKWVKDAPEMRTLLSQKLGVSDDYRFEFRESVSRTDKVLV